jgi:hypothetical protein
MMKSFVKRELNPLLMILAVGFLSTACQDSNSLVGGLANKDDMPLTSAANGKQILSKNQNLNAGKSLPKDGSSIQNVGNAVGSFSNIVTGAAGSGFLTFNASASGISDAATGMILPGLRALIEFESLNGTTIQIIEYSGSSSSCGFHDMTASEKSSGTISRTASAVQIPAGTVLIRMALYAWDRAIPGVHNKLLQYTVRTL